MDQLEKIRFLKQYQEWRRGSDDYPAPDPMTLGKVLDYAIECCERCLEEDTAQQTAEYVQELGAGSPLTPRMTSK